MPQLWYWNTLKCKKETTEEAFASWNNFLKAHLSVSMHRLFISFSLSDKFQFPHFWVWFPPAPSLQSTLLLFPRLWISVFPSDAEALRDVVIFTAAATMGLTHCSFSFHLHGYLICNTLLIILINIFIFCRLSLLFLDFKVLIWPRNPSQIKHIDNIYLLYNRTSFKYAAFGI